jgi:predicted ATP-dependent endonuclease of OLD family
MKITKIEIYNYRLLKKLGAGFRKWIFPLIIGKNNSGKTSVLSALKNNL